MSDIPEEIEELANSFEGSYFNTRVLMHHITGIYCNGTDYDETYFGIHEVYYNKEDKPIAWTENPIRVQFDDLDELGNVLQQIADAMEKTVLFVDTKDGKDEQIWDSGKPLSYFKEDHNGEC